MSFRPLLRCALLCLLFACSDDASDGKSSSSGGGTPLTIKACEDAADAVAKAAQRCGQDYQASYDGFVQGAAGGSCSNVVSIRDETALRQTCLPSLSTVSCEDLMAVKLDASCKAQLQRPAGFRPTLEPAGGVAAAAMTWE